jgi:hypothetical protein
MVVARKGADVLHAPAHECDKLTIGQVQIARVAVRNLEVVRRCARAQRCPQRQR